MPLSSASTLESILNLLRAKSGFEAGEITYYGKTPAGLRSILEAMRENIFTNLFRMAAKLGEGPDKNHSYHQNIQAGRDIWFSTYFMANELDQPALGNFDDNLIKAQAIGTVQSLTDPQVKRKVVLIAFDGRAQDAEADTKEFFTQVENILKKGKTANLALAQDDSAAVQRSVPVANAVTGGIDFRSMNITAQPMGSLVNLKFSLPKVENLTSFNPDREMRQIKDMLNAGVIPSSQRLKEYVAACYQKGLIEKYSTQILACLVDICKIEESQAVASDSGLKELLVIADAI